MKGENGFKDPSTQRCLTGHDRLRH